MKNLIIVLAFLITSISFAQGGGKVDAVKFRGKVTTSVRDAIDVPSGETWMIHNVTTDRIEVANENDVWESITAQLTGELRLDGYTTAERNALDVPAGEAWVIYNTTSNLVEISESNDVWVTVGDGLQEGANSVPGGVSLNQGITNSIEILPDGGAASANNPMVRIIGGNQSGAVYYLMYDDVIRWSFANSKTYTLNKDGVINPTDLADKAYVDGLDVTPDNSVSEVKIVDNAVTTSKVADNAITGAKIQSSTIERTKLAPSVSNSLDLADTAIQVDTDTQLTPTEVVAAVDSELGQTDWKTGGSGVTDGDKGDITVSDSGATFTIDADAVGSPEIVSNAVGRVELQNSAVTPEKLNASNIEQTGLVPVISVDTSEFDYIDPSTFDTDDQTASEVTVATTNFEVLTSTELQGLSDEIDQRLLEARATGVKEIGSIALNGATGVDIGAIEAVVYDPLAVSDPYKRISTTAKVNEQLANTAAPITYWYVDSVDNTIKQQTTEPTESEYREKVFFLLTSYTSSIGAITGFKTVGTTTNNTPERVSGLMRDLGVFRVSGLGISAEANDLDFIIAGGVLNDQGANVSVSLNDPDHSNLQTFNSSVNTYRLATSSGILSTDVSTGLDVLNYQVGGVVTEIPGNILQNANWGVIYFTEFAGGNVRGVYDVEFYADADEARARITTKEPLEFSPPGFENGFPIGAIAFRKGATDLSDDTQAFYFKTSKFGSYSGGATNSGVDRDNQTALEVPFTPNGDIAATNVQDAIEEVRNESGGGSQTDVLVSDVDGDAGYTIAGFEEIQNLVVGTQTAYDALGSYDSNVFYKIVSLNPPLNLASPSNTDTTVDLTWTEASDAAYVSYYELSINDSAAINIGSGTSYTATGRPENTTETYKIRAVESNGSASAYTDNISVTTDATVVAYANGNAASPTPNEGNAIPSGITGDTSDVVVTVNSSDSNNGSFSLQSEHQGPDNTSYNIFIPVTLEVGEIYVLDYDSKKVGGANISIFLSDSRGWQSTVGEFAGGNTTTDVWQNSTNLSGTASSTNAEIQINFSGAADTGWQLLLDKIELIKQ